MKILNLAFVILILSSCNFRKDIIYEIIDKSGESISVEDLIPSEISEVSTSQTRIDDPDYMIYMNFTYESGEHTLIFKIEDYDKTTTKTIKFTEVTPKEIDLGNGYKVRINMNKENQKVD